MQTAEYNPKQVQDQTDVDPSGLTGGSTLIWNGSFFETRPADFSDITGTLSIEQFPSDIVVTLDSIDEDALYFFDNTLFAPRLIGAAEAAAFIGLGSLTFGDIGGTLDISQFPPGTAATLDSIGEDALFFYDESLGQPKLINQADAVAFLGITGGDASTNTSSSVDSEVALFSGTGGKTLKRATGSGLALLTSGVLSTITDSSSNWNTAFTERHQWDGGATNLVAATGRTSLGLVIGTNVQAWDADLDALAALGGTNTIYYRSASNTWTAVTIGSGLSFSSGSLTATGTGVAADAIWDAKGDLAVGTGADTAAKLTVGANDTILMADSAQTTGLKWGTPSTVKTALGLVIGTNVQAWDADLDTLAGLTATTNNFIVSVGSAWASRTPAQVKTTLAIANTDVSGLGTASTLASDTDGTLATNSDSRIATQKAVKTYIDGINTALLAAIAALDSKDEVAYCATAALPTCNYANGTLGVGATLTATTNGPLIIDSVTTVIGAQGLGILVAGQASDFQNGWYTLTQQGVVAVSPWILTRRTPDDQAAEIGPGYLTAVEAPTGLTAGSNNQRVFLSISPTPFVVGTDSLTFAMVGGTYTAGNGLSLSGTAFSINTAITADLSTAQSLTNKKLGSLTSNGFVKTSSGDGTLSVDTASYQPLDSDLTTLAGLTATTDNFIVSVSSAWASRTPSQVRTTLGLVIGTNVQAWDADLDTWAGITPGTGVGTFLATPSSANLRAALTDELGTGAAIFDGATPSTGLTLTNCTALPIAGLTASTSTALGVGSIELGHATDTTITRVSAGLIAVEGSNLIRASDLGTNMATFLATPSSANLRSTMTDEIGTGACVFDGATLTLLLTLTTCTSSLASVNIPAGTVPTTPNDGDLFADANCFYGCTDTGNPGVIPIVHLIRADSTVTQANDANAHAIFTTPTNGRLTLETGCYRFKGVLSYSSMSATSGNIKIDILGAGGATAGAWLWLAYGQDQVTGGGANNITGQMMVSNTSTASIMAAGTATACQIVIDGTFEITGAGTIIPTQTVATAAAAVLAVGSFIEFWRVGSTSMTSVGQWD